MNFKTINKNSTAEIVEKKSRFIANIFYVETVKQVEEKLKKIKKQYHDAKHNCFAYIVTDLEGNTVQKSSDDGEPSGTAGAPMLKILTEKNLSNILVVVTRYFGGILLGTGGLVRAYSGATLEALEKTEYIQKSLGYEAVLQVSYKDAEKIKYDLEKNKIKIIKTEYNENIEISIEIPEEKIELLEKLNIKIQNSTKKHVEI